MTSPAQMLNEFGRKPFTLWDLKGKQFTVIEDLPYNGDMRQTKEMNEKYNKMQDFFFVKIEQGLFQKDLKMTETEMLTLFLIMPKSTKNYQGSMVAVDQINKLKLSYLGTTEQDLNGNRLGTSQNAPISQPQQPQQDQRDLFVSKLTAGMTTLEALGNKVDASVVMKICDNISLGKGMELFSYAKGKGAISETNGVWKVN